MHRRQYLRVLPAAGSLCLAGCTGNDDPGPATRTEARTDGATPQGGEETRTERPDASVETAVVGERVDRKHVSIVVRDVREPDRLGTRAAPDGRRFVVVRLALKNTGRVVVKFDPLVQVKLVDGERRSYDRAFETATDRPLQAGLVVPGEVFRGDVVFEIPEAAEGLQLAIADGFVGTVGPSLPKVQDQGGGDLDGQGPGVEVERDYVFAGATTRSGVHVDLGRTDSTVADLAQDLSVAVHGVGDTIEYEGMTAEIAAVEATSSSQDSPETEAVVVDLAVTNESGRELYVPALLVTVLKDGEGFSYAVDVEGTRALDGRFEQGSPIPDGETRRGTIAYEVPEGAAPLYFAFEFDTAEGRAKAFWQLR